jgi:hypothetical protein
MDPDIKFLLRCSLQNYFSLSLNDKILHLLSPDDKQLLPLDATGYGKLLQHLINKNDIELVGDVIKNLANNVSVKDVIPAVYQSLYKGYSDSLVYLYELLMVFEPDQNRFENIVVNILSSIIDTTNYDYIKTMIITLLKSGIYGHAGVDTYGAGFTTYLHEHPDLLNDIINIPLVSLSDEVVVEFIISNIGIAPGKTNDKVNNILFNLWDKKFRGSHDYYKLYYEIFGFISDSIIDAEDDEDWSKQSHYIQQLQKLLERVTNFEKFEEYILAHSEPHIARHFIKQIRSHMKQT